MHTFFSEEKLLKLLAVFVTIAICITRVSMAAGQVFQSLALLTGIILFVGRKGRVSFTPESKKYYLAALLFFVATMISAIGAINPGTVVKECFNMWIWRSIPFVLVAAFIYRRDYLVNMLIALLCIHGIESFSAAAECIILGGRGWGFGPVGTNPLALAGMMCLMLPAACILVLDPRFEQKLKKAAGFCTAGIIGGLLGAQSRGSWLVTVISMPISLFPYVRKSLKYLAIVVSVFALVAGFFILKPKYIQKFTSVSNVTTNWSNTHRLWLWKSCVNMFKDHPVNGIGLGNFGEFYANHGYWLHDGKMEPYEAEKLRRERLEQRKKVQEQRKKELKAVRKTKLQAQTSTKAKLQAQQSAVQKLKPQVQQNAKAKQQPKTKAQSNVKAAQNTKPATVKKSVVKQNIATAKRLPQRPKAFRAASHAHNSYYQLLAETGVIGFGGLLLFVLYYLGNSLRNWIREKNPYDLMFFASFLSFFVLFAQVEHIVDNSAAIRMMWFLLAVILQLKATDGPDRDKKEV